MAITLTNCPICDCCNCESCESLSPTTASVDVNSVPTDCSETSGNIAGGPYAVKACRPSLGALPSTCEDQWFFRYDLTINNNTDKCILFCLIFDIAGLDTGCLIAWKREGDSEGSQRTLGNGTGVECVCISPSGSLTLELCFRVNGCQNPCCFTEAELSDFRWTAKCRDSDDCDVEGCDNSGCPDCGEECCECCTIGFTGTCCNADAEVVLPPDCPVEQCADTYPDCIGDTCVAVCPASQELPCCECENIHDCLITLDLQGTCMCQADTDPPDPGDPCACTNTTGSDLCYYTVVATVGPCPEGPLGCV